MKVLQVLDELKPSGSEEMIRAASAFWKANGIEGHIYATGDSLGSYANALREAGYQIHFQPFSKSPRFLLQFYNCIRKNRFDAVHIHAERANFWYALLARAAGCPSITRSVNNVFPFTGLLRVRRFAQRAAMRYLLGVRTVSISQSVKDTEARYYSNPTILVPAWFDSSRYRPPEEAQRLRARESLGLAEDCFVAVSVGGCWSYKNHPAILRALQILPESSRVLYMHLGQEDEARSERALARNLGLGERVRFEGIVADILPWLHAADAFLMPSTYEGFGVAAVEAMGAGLPCVLSDVDGLRDFHVCGEGIRWVSPTAESIAAGLEYFYRLPAVERRQLGASLSASAHSRFGIERGAGACLKLYRLETVE